MAAGMAMLNYLNEHPEVYSDLAQTTAEIVQGMRENLHELGLNYTINHIGSMYSIFFTDKEVYDFETAKQCDTALFGRYFRSMLEKGVYLAPSQFETLFVSTAITAKEVDWLKQANLESLKAIHEA